TDWEIDICRRVDRLVTPCREAVEELARVDAAFGRLRVDFVLTGAAAAPAMFPGSRRDLRERWRLPRDLPIGLFIGSPQPYRGLDALLAALGELPADTPGMLAIAGPSADAIPRRPRVRAPRRAVRRGGGRAPRVDDVTNLQNDRNARDIVIGGNAYRRSGAVRRAEG